MVTVTPVLAILAVRLVARGTSTVVGIVSWGIGCGTNPGRNTEVFQYVDFIRSVMQGGPTITNVDSGEEDTPFLVPLIATCAVLAVALATVVTYVVLKSKTKKPKPQFVGEISVV